jgi:hypothetical protein
MKSTVAICYLIFFPFTLITDYPFPYYRKIVDSNLLKSCMKLVSISTVLSYSVMNVWNYGIHCLKLELRFGKGYSLPSLRRPGIETSLHSYLFTYEAFFLGDESTRTITGQAVSIRFKPIIRL